MKFKPSVYCAVQGVLAVQLFKNGHWTSVIIDDRFPVKTDQYYDVDPDHPKYGSPDASRGRFGSLYFARCENKKFWPLLIEKA
jgi:hypothetical protein